MSYKDMSQYRANRKESPVVQNWLNNYKQGIMNDVIFKDSSGDSFNKEWLDKVRDNPEVAEIVADTLIGWLNSPVGRGFIASSFNVTIPQGDD